jgi:hypothetical protein
MTQYAPYFCSLLNANIIGVIREREGHEIRMGEDKKDLYKIVVVWSHRKETI